MRAISGRQFQRKWKALVPTPRAAHREHEPLVSELHTRHERASQLEGTVECSRDAHGVLASRLEGFATPNLGATRARARHPATARPGIPTATSDPREQPTTDTPTGTCGVGREFESPDPMTPLPYRREVTA